MQPVKGSATFSSREKLKSSREIKAVMNEHMSCTAFPIKCFYRVVEGEGPTQLAVVVSKRRIKQAVDRNRVKRLMRESYRLQKKLLPPMEQNTLQMCWLYMDETMPQWDTIEQAGTRILKTLSTKLLEL